MAYRSLLRLSTLLQSERGHSRILTRGRGVRSFSSAACSREILCSTSAINTRPGYLIDGISGGLPAGSLATRECLWVATLQSQTRAFYSAHSAASKVVAVGSDSEFTSALKEAEASNKLAVVDFTAVWCAPCRTIAPLFERLSTELDDVAFLKIDIDEEGLQETVSQAGIRAVPTFHFHKGGQRVAEFSGADEAKLKELIEVLRQA